VAAESSKDQWGGSAEAWARLAEKEETGASARAGEWMLEGAGLASGERVLELACGAGRVGLQAAPLLGAGGSILCSDFSAEMVAAVDRRVERLGLDNVETAVLDAQSLDLDDESFDVALCRFGYMLMPEPGRALAETQRVLRPGGRLVMAVWGEAEANPWLTTIFEVVMERLGAPPPPPGTPGPFALGEAGTLEGMLEEACLENIEVVKLDAEQPYGSAEDWWRHNREVSGPLTALFSALSAEDVEAIERESLSRAHHYERDGGVVFPAAILGARAMRPG
jgi:SAM-dependent methyltransferase